MTGGTIDNCSASDGGGVYLDSGSFTLDGGTISNCTADYHGGGVHDGDYGTFTMTGGTISDCTAATNGGGVYIRTTSCAFTMSGGTITGCKATASDSHGGGICLQGGNLTITGGSVYNCTAATNPLICYDHDGSSSDVSVPTYTVTFMSGGTEYEKQTIYGAGGTAIKPMNDPTRSGYAFLGWFNGKAEWNFDTVITGNVTLTAGWEEATPEKYPEMYHKVTFDDGESQSVLHILKTADDLKLTEPDEPTRDDYIFHGWYNGTTKWDFSKDVTESMTLTAKFEAVTPENSPDLYYKVTFDPKNGSAKTVKYVKKASDCKVGKPADPSYTGKSYYHFAGWYLGNKQYSFDMVLTGDITLTAKWNNFVLNEKELRDAINNKESLITLGADFTIYSRYVIYNFTTTLDLNGHILKSSGKYGLFYVLSGNFTLKDSSPNTVHSGYPNGGVLTGGSNYNGGCIEISYGTFTMTGGTIYKCTASGYGGAVSVGEGNSKFNMKGGTIDSCTNTGTEGKGGGVYVDAYATMNMSGGTIKNCKATGNGSSGGGIHNFGTLTMAGGTITNCKATARDSTGGGICSDGKAYLNGGKVTNCTASDRGGGLFVNNNGGYAVLNGSTIQNCTATNAGGGVCIDHHNSATFIMNSGTITNCKATASNSHGGGICLQQGKLTINGGTITNCTAATNPLICRSHSGSSSISVPTYTVTFSTNGGAGSYAAQTFYGTGITVTKPASDPTRDRYTFVGWFDPSNEEWDFSTAVTRSMTLTAKWDYNYHTVAFVDAENRTTEELLKSGDLKVTKPADPTRNGYEFLGWYTNGGGKWDFDENTVSGDITLTASWLRVVSTEEELRKAIEDGETEIKLGGDITLTGDLDISQDLVIDLNGNDLNADGNTIKTNGGLTIDDSGENGTFGGGTVNGDIANNATISGGEFNGKVTNNGEITEGSFYGGLDGDGELGENICKVTLKDGETVISEQIFVNVENVKLKEVAPGEKQDYTFDGWFNGDDKWDFDTTISADNDDFTLNTKWTKIASTPDDINDAINGGDGSIKIDGEVSGGEITIPDGSDVTIDIDGNDVDVDITVKPGGTLNIVDGSENGSGSLKGDVDNNGTITGGNISGNVTNGENGTIEGGNIAGDVENGGTISGGNISGNVTNDGTISGGTISGDVENNGTITGEDTIITGTVTGDGTIDDTAMVCVTYIDGDILVTYALDREEIAEDQILRGQRAANRSAKARNGYRFNGWYIDECETDENEDIIDMQTVAYDFDQPVLEDIVLLAMWTDVSAPEIKGLEDGKTYEGDVDFTVSDNDELAGITVNGKPLTPNADGGYTLKPSDEKQVVKVTDINGNTTTITVTVTEKKTDAGTNNGTGNGANGNGDGNTGDGTNSDTGNGENSDGTGNVNTGDTASGHDKEHALTHVPAVPATKETQGNIEYWYCAKCDKYFADAAGTKEISKADTITAKLTETPQTGDSTDLLLWFTLLTLCGAAMVYSELYAKKRKMK